MQVAPADAVLALQSRIYFSKTLNRKLKRLSIFLCSLQKMSILRAQIDTICLQTKIRGARE